MQNLNNSITGGMTLSEYFRNMFKQIQCDWNVESALKVFGKGKSNEGSDEAKTIKRYYVEPTDKRFRQIFLNFNSDRQIDSIVWFLDKNEGNLLSLKELKDLFGEFQFQNVIYDETTQLTFLPKGNKHIQYIQTSILEWVEKRKDGTLYIKENKKEIEIDDKYKVLSLIYNIKNSA